MLLLGYAGAIGIVFFGLRSSYAALFADAAASLNPLDFAILAAAATALAVYAISLGDTVFLLANAVSAVSNLLTAVLALRARRRAAQHS